MAWAYISAQDKGLAEPTDKLVFRSLPGMTLDDVTKFQEENLKDMKFSYAILGDTADLNLEALSKYGRVVVLTLEDIFGY